MNEIENLPACPVCGDKWDCTILEYMKERGDSQEDLDEAASEGMDSVMTKKRMITLGKDGDPHSYVHCPKCLSKWNRYTDKQVENYKNENKETN
jgi:formate dehydrogenase maturation protein FdhE